MLSLRSRASPAAQGASHRPWRGPCPGEAVQPLAGATAYAAALPTPDPLPSQDWAALFGAVTERLQRLAGSSDAAAAAGPAALRLPLQECVDGLRQVQQGLDARLQAAEQLQAELAAARTQLRDTRAELAHTQIGRQRAEHAALHDALTRLPNRSHFQARLEDGLRRAGPDGTSLAVLYVDLDGFKRINDEHGHDAGDATLCIVAQRLTRALRAQDTVCRLGGDEFACLLVAPGGREQLAQLACKLFDAVAAPLQVGARRFSVQPSIGIAVYPEHGVCVGTLLQRADAAMFDAKRQQLGYAFCAAGGPP